MYEICGQTTLKERNEDSNDAGIAVEEAAAQHKPSLPFFNEEFTEEDCEGEFEDQAGGLEDDFTTQEREYDGFASLSREDGIGGFRIGKDESDDAETDEEHSGDEDCPVVCLETAGQEVRPYP